MTEAEPDATPPGIAIDTRPLGTRRGARNGARTVVETPTVPGVPTAGPDAAPESPPPVEHILKALLFAGGEPISAERAEALVRGLTVTQFRSAIDDLNRGYRRQGRPYAIHVEDRRAVPLRSDPDTGVCENGCSAHRAKRGCPHRRSTCWPWSRTDNP